MAQVMDPTQASGQIQLLTELRTRFPEVPVDIIGVIMQQSYYNRERCIEILAKECQKYQSMLYNRSVVTSPMACRSTEDIWQQNCGSAESLSSVSSGHSVGTPSFVQTNQDIGHSPMRSSQSYTYIPPTESSGRVHDPAPRASLPMPLLDTVPPRMGVSSPATAAVMQRLSFSSRPDPQVNQDLVLPHSAGILVMESFSHGMLRQHGIVEGGRNLPGGSPAAVNAVKTSKPKTVTSGVSYRVNPVTSSGEQSKPTYLTATHVNMLSPEAGDDRLRHERSQKRLSSDRSSNACSAVYINPQQSWLSSPQTPTTYVSSLSSSCDCLLPSVTDASKSTVFPSLSTCLPASSASSVLPSTNSSSPIPSSQPVTDPKYADALKMCQSVNFDQLMQKQQELVQYSIELRLCIGRMESELTHRLLQRSQAFPTAEDVEKLKQENRKLRVDIQLLAREIDLADNGQMPLGVLDPEEQQSFKRRDSFRQSEGSNSASISSPVTPHIGVMPALSYVPQVPSANEISTSRQCDEPEGENWHCAACTFLNHPALKHCECCEMPRVPAALR